jgi:hypothetical protein
LIQKETKKKTKRKDMERNGTQAAADSSYQLGFQGFQVGVRRQPTIFLHVFFSQQLARKSYPNKSIPKHWEEPQPCPVFPRAREITYIQSHL